MTADTQPITTKAQSQQRRVRPPKNNIVKTDLSQGWNAKPLGQILAEQRAADDKMRMFVKGARQHDNNIEKILSGNTNDWSSLYSHPKLMGQYYWKDDAIHTNK